MADTVERILLDASGVVSGAAQASGALSGINTASFELSKTWTQVNDIGEKLKIGFQGINSAGQQIQGTLKNTAQGWEAVSIKLKEATKELDNAGNAAKKTAGIFGLTATSIARLLAVTTIRHVFLDIASGMREAVKAAAEFQAKMGQIQALNKNVGNTQQLGQQMAQRANQFNQPIGEVASAARQGVQSGAIQSAGDMNTLTEAMRLAQVAGISTGSAMSTLGGIMQAFRLPTSEAANTMNQLFHVAQHGGDLESIGDTLRNTGASAARLNITLPDMLHAFELLKARGSTGADAMSQLQGTLTGLERRTAEFDKILLNHGYVSVQAAAADGGLGNVLRLLAERMDETGESARKLLSSRRALGTLTLGEELSRGENPLNNREELAAEAARAGQVIRENTTFQAEFNKIATAFATEIGPKILDAFKAFGEFSGPIIAIGTEIAKWAPVIVNTVNGFIIWAGWLGKVGEGLGLINRQLAGMTEATRKLNEARAANETAYNAGLSRQREETEGTARMQEQVVTQSFKPQVMESQKAVESAREAASQMKEQAEAAAQGIMHSLSKVLSDFESIAKKAEAEIINSLKRVGEAADKADQDAFKHRLATAGSSHMVSPFKGKHAGTEARDAVALNKLQNNDSANQLTLLRDRTARVTAEVAELYRKGDDASIASARRKEEELLRINDEIANTEAARSRRNADLQGRLTGRAQQYNPFNDEREAGANALNAASAQREAAYQAMLRQRQQSAEDASKSQRDANKEASLTTSRFFRQNNVEHGGELNPQFAGPGGGAALNESLTRGVERVMAELTRAARIGPDNADRMLRAGQISREQRDQIHRDAPSDADLSRTRDALNAHVDAQLALRNAMQAHVEIKQKFDAAIAEIKSSAQLIAQSRLNASEANRMENKGLTDSQTIGNEIAGHTHLTAWDNISLQDQAELRNAKTANNAAALAAQRDKTPENMQLAAAALERLLNIAQKIFDQKDARNPDRSDSMADRSIIKEGRTTVSNLREANVVRLQAEQAVVREMRIQSMNAASSMFDSLRAPGSPGATPTSAPAPGSAEALWDSLNGGATTPRGATAPSPSRMDADGNIGPQASAGGSSDTASASPGHGGGIAGMIATAMDGLATGAVGHATASHHPTAPAFAPGPAVGVSASGGSGSRGSGSLGTGSGPFGAGGPQNSIAGNGSEFGPAVNSSNLYQSNLATAQRMLQYSPGRDTENSQDAITAVARMFGVKPEDLYIPKAPNILKPNADGTYTLPSPGGGSTTVGGGVLTVNSPGVGDRSNIFNGSVPNEDEEGFASGGLIGNAFSAMGPDNVRINARVGEFVMNPDSSRQFYSQLVSMNRGDSPRGGGYATGGTVNNSIGHMNINVNGADSPDKTARAVYSRIRREQRRGNI